jgi:homoserine O-acetyltransferase
MSVTVRATRAARVPYRTGTVWPDGSTKLEHGGSLSDYRIGYSLAGEQGAPVVAVLGGISAHRHVAAGGGHAGWWDAVVGAGRTIDVREYRVLSIDWLGGPGSSMRRSPASPREAFPVTPRDQANALVAVVTALGIAELRGVIGASYGGAVALAFAADHADRAAGALVIGATHASHPLSTAVRWIQREIVRLSLDEKAGLALARALAVTTYGSAPDWQRRFGARSTGNVRAVRFAFEEWLVDSGRRFAAHWTAQDFHRLSLSLDLHDVDPAAIRLPVTLLSIEPDFVAPRWQMEELAASIAGPCRLIPLDSIHGHDVFLEDPGAIAPVIDDFLGTPGLSQ